MVEHEQQLTDEQRSALEALRASASERGLIITVSPDLTRIITCLKDGTPMYDRPLIQALSAPSS